jgi:DNA-binding transcriptional regulator YdaS (Cro superfamily)
MTDAAFIHGELFSAEQVRQYLREECAEAGSQKAWAQKHGLSPAYITDVLLGRREPGEAIVSALGFERLTVYRPKA